VITFIDEAAASQARPRPGEERARQGRRRARSARTVEREGAALGVLVTLEPPTRDMQAEAAQPGSTARPAGADYPRIQILTIATSSTAPGANAPWQSRSSSGAGEAGAVSGAGELFEETR